jgi:hypothetical protein
VAIARGQQQGRRKGYDMTEDEEFERISHEQKYTRRDKRIDQGNRVGEPLSVTYSIKLTQSQRVALIRLGPEWVRSQIDAASR